MSISKPFTLAIVALDAKKHAAFWESQRESSLPFWLEAMEHQLDEFRTAENRGLKMRPKEYFKKHFWVTFWFESFAPKHMLEEIGVDRLLFETDFPHPTSLYPGVQAKLVDSLGGHDYATRKRILETNAFELYNLKF